MLGLAVLVIVSVTTPIASASAPTAHVRVNGLTRVHGSQTQPLITLGAYTMRAEYGDRLGSDSGVVLREGATGLAGAYESARGRGPGRSQQQISSNNYLNNFKAFGPIMNGAKIIDDPSPTPKPPITSVTQWTPRYRRVTQIKTMNTRAAAHSR